MVVVTVEEEEGEEEGDEEEEAWYARANRSRARERNRGFISIEERVGEGETETRWAMVDSGAPGRRESLYTGMKALVSAASEEGEAVVRTKPRNFVRGARAPNVSVAAEATSRSRLCCGGRNWIIASLPRRRV